MHTALSADARWCGGSCCRVIRGTHLGASVENSKVRPATPAEEEEIQLKRVGGARLMMDLDRSGNGHERAPPSPRNLHFSGILHYYYR